MTFITKIQGREGHYTVNGVDVTTSDYSKLNLDDQKVFEKYIKCLGGVKVQKSIV